MQCTFPATSFRFSASTEIQPAADGASGERQFSGIAYAGEIITDHPLGPIAFDIASMRFDTPLPVLCEHERDETVGVLESVQRGSDVRVAGRLFSDIDDEAAAIAAKADKGFPWGLSFFLIPSSIEEVSPGAEYSINGRSVTGPLTVLKGCRARELSFCSVAADGGTHASVFSGDESETINVEVETMADSKEKTDLETQLRDLEAKFSALSDQLTAEKARADAAETALADHLKAARTAEVKALFAAQDREWDEVKAAPYMAMTGEQFSAVKADFEALKAKTVKLPELLFSHQATGGGPANAPTINELHRAMLAEYGQGGGGATTN